MDEVYGLVYDVHEDVVPLDIMDGRYENIRVTYPLQGLTTKIIRHPVPFYGLVDNICMISRFRHYRGYLLNSISYVFYHYFPYSFIKIVLCLNDLQVTINVEKKEGNVDYRMSVSILDCFVRHCGHDGVVKDYGNGDSSDVGNHGFVANVVVDSNGVKMDERIPETV